jgi:hypothetical protein
VLKAFHRWGADCVRHFAGMFAFAIADTGVVTLARDRLGIKPLYLAESPARLRFASTLPALLRGGVVDTGLDRVALHHYLSSHSVVPAPRTIFRGVRKLPAATVRVIRPDSRSTDTRYWQPVFGPDPDRASWTEHDWQHALLDALRTAVSRRWSPTCPSGYCCPEASTRAWWSPCSPSRASTDRRLSVSDSIRRQENPVTSTSTRIWSPTRSAPRTTGSTSTPRASCLQCPRPSRR